MSNEGGGFGCLAVLLVMALMASLAGNYLQYKGRSAGESVLVTTERSTDETDYLRNVAESFGLHPAEDRQACDIATDLKLMAGTRCKVPSRLLADKTVEELCEVISKEEAELLRSEHRFILKNCGKTFIVLEDAK